MNATVKDKCIMVAELLIMIGGVYWLIINGYLWCGFAGTAFLLMCFCLEEDIITAGLCGPLLASALLGEQAYGMAFCIQIPLIVMLSGHYYYWTASFGGSIFVLTLFGCFMLDQNMEAIPTDSTVTTVVQVDASTTQQAQTRELGRQIEQWRESRSKLCALATKLDRERIELLRQLDQWGVNSLSGSETDPRAKVLLGELREVLQQQILVGKRQDQYGLAIIKSESRLRSIERRIAAKDAGVGDADLGALARSVIALDESLAAESELEVPIELDQLLLDQLKKR